MFRLAFFRLWPISAIHSLHLVVLVTAATCGSLVRATETDAESAKLQAHLAAGEFGLAAQMAAQARTAGERDSWLQQIATAQATAGMFSTSLATASEIDDDQARSSAFQQLAELPIGGRAARGGAALADFDSLIELIESTISPDSWDEVGGPGAIEEFPGGVFVDATGLVKRIAVDPSAAITLEAAHAASRWASRHDDVRAKSALRKVSLTRLERQLQMLWARGRQPVAAMRNLAGLQQIKYVFVYPDSRDIVLAGPAGDWKTDREGRTVSADTGRPVLQLDDLVVTLRNAFEDDRRFGCSITPRRDNLATVQSYLAESAKQSLRPGQRDKWLSGLRERLGRQDVEVFGIDPQSHAARMLVEADYRMKLVGMGLEAGTRGVTSYLASISIPAGGSPPPMDVLRWWFTLEGRGLRATSDGNAIELSGTSVKVLSENEMLTARGERIHTGKSNALNSDFASSFTKHFADLAVKYPVYADLENVFDLAIVAAIIRDRDLAAKVHWKMSHLMDRERFQVAHGPIPAQVETVMNHRLIGKKHIVVGVSGGVSVDTRQLADAIEIAENNQLDGTRRSSGPRDTNGNWWWD